MCASSSRAAINDGESRALLGPGVPGGIDVVSRRGVLRRCMRLRLLPFCAQSSGGRPPRGALIERGTDPGGRGGGMSSVPASAGDRDAYDDRVAVEPRGPGVASAVCPDSSEDSLTLRPCR